MILPTKAMATQELTVKRKLSGNTLQVQASSPVALGVRIPTVALHMMELFDTTVEQLYSIFTVKDLTKKKIIMKWRCRNWPEGITLCHGCTEFCAYSRANRITIEGVPICKEENMKFCWQKQHFEEIKGLLQLTPLNG
ncbi:AHSA2 isoform 1 [Pan troglodytes]|uniref:AHSA2 isoform 1 n=1 Tax=Pan troglodytes TaxID=9598 RepID=A0A2J8N3L6_PANTR|nr:AHSA2 isoform 1 [Pan troglodytes]